MNNLVSWHKETIESISSSVSYHNEKLLDYNIDRSKKYYLRVSKDGKMGFVYTDEEKKCNETEALKNSIEFNYDLPELENDEIIQVYRELEDIDFEDYLSDLKNFEHKSLKGKNIGVSYTIQSSTFEDQNGNRIYERSSWGFTYIDLIFDNFSFYIGYSGFDLDNIKKLIFEDINLVLESPKIIKISEKVPIVIIDGQFYKYFVESFYGNEIKEKTYWTHAVLGEKICNFNMIDDPNLLKPHIKYDSDGIKTKKKAIIEDGIFKTPLFDYYYGKIYGEESTGNGFHRGLNGIHYTKLLIDAKEKNRLEELDKCILAYSLIGLHTCNWNSGDISGSISYGLYIEKGEVKGVVTKYDYSFNLKEVLPKVELLNMRIENGALVYYPFILNI